MKTRRLFLQYMKYAAAVVLGIGVSLSTLYLTNQENLSTVGNYKLVTSKGEKSYLQLPDGTRVWLNSCTTLEYAENYGHSNRSIYLDGEAYFEVAKNKDLPFVVKANGIDVKAIGTAFNVSAYMEDSQLTTTLFNGKVAVQPTLTKQEVIKPRMPTPECTQLLQSQRECMARNSTTLPCCTPAARRRSATTAAR